MVLQSICEKKSSCAVQPLGLFADPLVAVFVLVGCADVTSVPKDDNHPLDLVCIACVEVTLDVFATHRIKLQSLFAGAGSVIQGVLNHAP